MIENKLHFFFKNQIWHIGGRWRSELCWKTISRTIGFKPYAVIMIIIGILRLSGIGLSFADYGSWFTPGWIAWSISVLIFILFIYTIYSIKKYFGFMRATGIHHLIYASNWDRSF